LAALGAGACAAGAIALAVGAPSAGPLAVGALDPAGAAAFVMAAVAATPTGRRLGVEAPSAAVRYGLVFMLTVGGMALLRDALVG
jgi:hypothetical protein